MAPKRSLLCAAAAVGLARAKLLSDEELRQFYGYRYMDGPTRELPQPLDASQTLKQAAEQAGIYIAAAINYGGMTGSFGPNYTSTVLSQMSGMTAENECKVGPIHPEPGTYTFDQCDYLMSTLIKNGSMARFHNTCWHEENPDWLNALKDPNELTSALVEHINNITDHYMLNSSLAYYAIDVVNEAVSDSGSSTFKPVTPWYPALPDYVTIAFNAAQAASQNVAKAPLLCYNDYGAEGWSSAKAQKIYAMVKDMRGNGVPVQCVGLQMHISVDSHPTADDVRENIKQLGALNVTVHITEMDVKCPNCSPARLAAQAQVYADMLQACLDNANCASFETWGIFDANTWVGTQNAPLLWDVDWNPKPAYYAVLATLQKHAARRARAQA